MGGVAAIEGPKARAQVTQSDDAQEDMGVLGSSAPLDRPRPRLR